MPQSVAEFLKAELPAELYERLRRASRDWSIPAFAFNRDTGMYECVLSPETSGAQDEGDAEEAVDESFLDAVCAACELLSGAGRDFTGDPCVLSEEPGGEVKFEHRFGPDQEELYQHFRSQLNKLTSTEEGIDAQFQKYPGGFRVEVRIAYQSELDYHRKKDLVDWAMQLARMRASKRPFKGIRF